MIKTSLSLVGIGLISSQIEQPLRKSIGLVRSSACDFNYFGIFLLLFFRFLDILSEISLHKQIINYPGHFFGQVRERKRRRLWRREK
jgi:hypothetical protein